METVGKTVGKTGVLNRKEAVSRHLHQLKKAIIVIMAFFNSMGKT